MQPLRLYPIVQATEGERGLPHYLASLGPVLQATTTSHDWQPMRNQMLSATGWFPLWKPIASLLSSSPEIYPQYLAPWCTGINDASGQKHQLARRPEFESISRNPQLTSQPAPVISRNPQLTSQPAPVINSAISSAVFSTTATNSISPSSKETGRPGLSYASLVREKRNVGKISLSGDIEEFRRVKRARRDDIEDGTLNGEQRLLIEFESFGNFTEKPQKIGRKFGFIPDGIAGSFLMYGESWGFEVRHDKTVLCFDGEERTCIRWTITNKASQTTHSVVESAEDAFKRDVRGVSLCNKVFVHAMELRARDYEAMIEAEMASSSPNMLKISNHRVRAQCLRPRRFSEGPLLFGLRHRCVHEHLNSL